jgi:FAD:protein FMN transferase
MGLTSSRSFRYLVAVSVLGGAMVLASLAATSGPAAEKTSEFVFHQDGVLGTSLDLTVVCRSQAQADAALASVLDEIERLRRILSTYDRESELSRLAAATGPTRCSGELIEVLGAADGWRNRSGGAFNAQLGDLAALWADAARTDRLPDDSALRRAADRAAQPMWQIDPAARTVTRTADVRPAVDALAKGYIIEKAVLAAKAKDPSLAGLMLAIGGDIRTLGSPVEGPGAPWLVGVVDPRHPQDNAPMLAGLRLRDAAVTTSGHYGHFYTINGHQYSHIFDPRTGRPAGAVAGATVVAPDAMTADALSTTLCVLEPEDGLKLVAAVPGAQCLIVGSDGHTWTSPGWKDIAAPLAAVAAAGAGGSLTAVAAPPAAGPAWPAGFAVNLEINLVARGKRPYVATWVEDSAGKPVRMIALWGNEQKYFKDLPAWWAKYKTQTTLLKGVTRATRVAGKYSLLWDGLDDAGKPVAPGKYIVRIETAQEDGPHLMLAGEVICDKSPVNFSIPGNRHIQAVGVTYGPAPTATAK